MACLARQCACLLPRLPTVSYLQLAELHGTEVLGHGTGNHVSTRAEVDVAHPHLRRQATGEERDFNMGSGQVFDMKETNDART